MSYENPRIDLFQAPIQSLVAMAEGNPGAMTVIGKMLKCDIDPSHIMGPMAGIMMLDNLDIYGSDIWLLYKEACKENVERMVGLLRCCQMGIVPCMDIVGMIEDASTISIEMIDDYIAELKQQLPSFGSSAVQQEE